MDPVSAVGLAASIYSLLEAASAIPRTIERLSVNYPQRCSRSLDLVNRLIQVLASAETVSEPAADLVSSSLKDVESRFKSLIAESGATHSVFRFVGESIGVSKDKAKFEAAEKKLEDLVTQVVVHADYLQLRKEMPHIFNNKMELPPSHAGLDRAKPILEFLEASKTEKFRVIGIHGLPGVGKTTLLNCIWNKVSSKAPFMRKAHVQIGHAATPPDLLRLQTIILQQLGAGRSEFTSSEGAKAKLQEHFDKLRGNKEPVFLAIDNVFDAEHIRCLLPNLSKDILPTSSCIAVTCRDRRVIRAFLNTCHLNENNHSQVCCHAPACLDLDESKKVFAACGDLSPVEDAELLDALVPLCKGLPLALSVLGRIFAGAARRERKEWESIAEQMQVLDGDDAETSPVTNSLRISYDLLNEARKAAFLEVVNIYYGWPWDRVERILGVNVVKDLKDSSLISITDYWFKCNQSALRPGFNQFFFHERDKPVVTMHDLILKFGEHLQHDHLAIRRTFDGSQPLESLLQDLEVPKLRSFHVCGLRTSDQQGLDKFLERAVNLQMLCVDLTGGFKPLIRVTNPSTNVRPQSLCFLSLKGWSFNRLLMETKLSQLREIHLHDCKNVMQLPETPLCQLEWLSIRRCANFQGFSPFCVQNWQKLQHLEVHECCSFTTIPTELGHLKKLTSLVCQKLDSLKTFPNLVCPGLQRLELVDIPITNLHLETPSLEILKVHCHKSLKGLPLIISNALALQELIISNWDSLEELPDEVGKLTSLIRVSIFGCGNWKRLPRTIGNASSLQMLSVEQCDSLEELPDEVGKLTLLKQLYVLGCKNLKRLPRTIGNASSLTKLWLQGCDSLEELPDEVGKLTLLKQLDVLRCKNLKRLPRTIGNASSLTKLSLQGCDSLEELPDEVGKLTLLTELDVLGCKNLKRLPRTIGNASSLTKLRLHGCDSLEELPDEVGKLTLLKQLYVLGCKNLKRLPRTIGNASSLTKLGLQGCDSLEELPDEVGKLTLLEQLDVLGCKNLKRLPRTIGNASSLSELFLSHCDSLEELPDEVGNLTSLKEVHVCGCENLKRLPQAIGNASSLSYLMLKGCTSLVELPDEVGKLTSLELLDLSKCRNLKRLPQSIGNVSSSLKRLRLEGCKSLAELPEEVKRWMESPSAKVGLSFEVERCLRRVCCR